MINKLIRQSFIILISLILMIILLGTTITYTATNTIPSLRLSQESESIFPNSLKPNACASLNLSNVIQGSGTVNGTASNELVLGSTADDFIRGRQGDDCIVGGDGNDTIDGNNGYDICIGGPGIDSFSRCEETYQ